MIYHLIIHSLKGAAWVAENFPDDPRLGRRLLVAGAALTGIGSYLSPSILRDSTAVFRSICLIAGGICGFLGFIVFFRRAVWWRQQKAGSGLTSLELGGRNNSVAGHVSKKNDGESIFGDSPD